MEPDGSEKPVRDGSSCYLSGWEAGGREILAWALLGSFALA